MTKKINREKQRSCRARHHAETKQKNDRLIALVIVHAHHLLILFKFLLAFSLLLRLLRLWNCTTKHNTLTICMRFSIKIKSVRLKPSSSLVRWNAMRTKSVHSKWERQRKKATEINIRHQVPATRLRNGFRVASAHLHSHMYVAHILILAQFSFVSSFFISTRSAYTLQIEKIVIERNMSTIFFFFIIISYSTWHLAHDDAYTAWTWSWKVRLCVRVCVCFLSSLSFSMHFSTPFTVSCRNSDTRECVCPFRMIIEFVRVTCHWHTETDTSPIRRYVCRVHHFSTKQLCYNFNESHRNRNKKWKKQKTQKNIFYFN